LAQVFDECVAWLDFNSSSVALRAFQQVLCAVHLYRHPQPQAEPIPPRWLRRLAAQKRCAGRRLLPADHKAQRLSELEFLNIVQRACEQVVRPRNDDVPAHIRDNANVVAFYHALEKHLGAVTTNGRDVRSDSAEAAQTMLDRIEQRRVVNWTQRDDIQNEMRNDLDDYLFDVVRDQKGYALTPAAMDEIMDRLLSIARARMVD